MTRVAMLTPAGTAAIATLAVVGSTAWEVVKARFRPAGGKPLPASPPENHFWYGSLGDEVVVAVKRLTPEPWIEVHCHGGRRVVRWLIEQFQADGCQEVRWQELELRPPSSRLDSRALDPLTHAPTLRTASILLDQYHGAFCRAVEEIRTAPETHREPLTELARLVPLGRHLVQPWRVVVAGAPNAGKSSLINALAGYQRSIVAPIAGTTRDVVTVPVALDGWPIELADTAGLRAAAAGLEAEGIDRARSFLATADLVLWLVDTADPTPTWPEDSLAAPVILVANKCDLPPAWDLGRMGEGLRLSAATGAGLPELIAAITRRLVPSPPASGAAVPFTPALAERIERAQQLLTAGEIPATREILSQCLLES